MKLGETPFEDIVFENLNKNYGAYEIRKLYPQHISRALWTSAVFATAFLVAPLLYQELFSKSRGIEEQKEVVIEIKEILKDAPQKTEQPPVVLPPPPPPKMEVATQRFLKIEPVPDDVAQIEEPPTQDQLAKAQISNHTQEGVTDDGSAVIEIDENSNNRISEVVDVTPSEETLFVTVEQMPSFQGGMTALQQYLSTHLRYPRVASANSIEGTVYIQFTVDRDGSITNVKVLKGIGYGCDEEAIRVVRLMPTWNAGKQAGKHVKVQFNLPIRFKLAE